MHTVCGARSDVSERAQSMYRHVMDSCMPVCLFLATACIDSYANKRSIEINIGERNGTRTNCSTIEIPTAVSRYASPLAYLKLTWYPRDV